MSYDDAAVRPLLDLEGLKAVACRAGRPATRRSSARSTGSGSTTTRGLSPRPSTRLTGRPRRRSGSTAAGTCWSSARLRRCRSARGCVVHRTRPGARACTSRAWCRGARPRHRRSSHRRRLVVVPRQRDRRPLARRRAGGRRDAAGVVTATRRRDWGLAARGALVEAGGPDAALRPRRPTTSCGPTSRRRLYAQARPRSGIPATAIPWDAPVDLPRRGRGRGRAGDDVPDREREGRADRARRASSAGSTRTSARCMQLLAIQAADEARHIEVFTRRALLPAARAGRLDAPAAGRRCRRCSTSPTSRSRRSCSRCSARAASSPCSGSSTTTRPTRSPARSRTSARRTRRATSRSASRTSSARRRSNPRCAARLASPSSAGTTRCATPRASTHEVFDALVVLAAGAWTPAAIAAGYAAVQTLAARHGRRPPAAARAPRLRRRRRGRRCRRCTRATSCSAIVDQVVAFGDWLLNSSILPKIESTLPA